MENQITVMDRL